MTGVPHFAFPFTIGGLGSAEVLEQDDQLEIEQNVKVLLLTEQGERLEVPSFGIPDPTFRTGFDTQEVVRTAELWDNRAVVFVGSRIDEMVRNVRVNVEEQ